MTKKHSMLHLKIAFLIEKFQQFQVVDQKGAEFCLVVEFNHGGCATNGPTV